MPIEATSMPNRMRRRALWIALGLVLMQCAWLASRDDDASADIAHPLTHAVIGAAPPAHSPAAGSDPMRERRLVASLRQALAASAAGADFSPLTDVGRSAWAGAVPPLAAASSSTVATAAVPPPTFPFQWVGMWTQPGKTTDSADDRSMAIIAGPHSTWMVKQGDVLDEDWKIASISASQIQVTHLPTSSRQTITMSKQ